jgi:hypothetical protein
MLSMTREDCEGFAADVHIQLSASPSPLGEKIARALNDYSVAFLIQKSDSLKPAGSGTTVSYRGTDYFLTASHVWHEKLKDAEVIAVPLKEDSKKYFSIRPSALVACGPDKPANWSEWGPDIVLLRIPPELVGKFRANGRSFHNLSHPTRRSFVCAVDYWFQLGAPAERGHYTHDRGVPEMDGILVWPSTGYYGPPSSHTPAKDEFDFIDVPLNTSLRDVASRPQGISGGGLWRVYLYKNPEGEIEWMRILEGVAFFGLPRNEPNIVVIRCHGPQSIGWIVNYLEGFNSRLWPPVGQRLR